MSGNTDYGFLLRKFRKEMRGAPIIDDDDWKEANKKFVSDLRDSIKIIKFSPVSNKKKINEYKLIQEFIDESISEISEVLQGNSLMADKLTSNMVRNVSGVYKSLAKNINALKPTVETTAAAAPVEDAAPEAEVRIMTPVSEEVPPDRMTQDTNIKTGGGISGFVGRIREMIEGPKVKSNNPIPEASIITIPQAIAVPIPPSEERPIQQPIRPGRNTVSTLGGSVGVVTPLGTFMGGGGAPTPVTPAAPAPARPARRYTEESKQAPE